MPPGVENTASPLPRLDSGFLESLFASAGFAIVACDMRGRIVSWNPAATKLFGDSAGLTEGGDVAGLLPERDRPQLEECMQRCLTAPEALEFKTRLGGTEDDPIWFAVYVTPVIDAEEVFRGVGVWFRDITVRMRLERDMKRHERLGSLGSMSGAVAHHYSNLLCGIATSIEYAMNMNTVPAMKRALNRANDSVARGSTITQQLLAFSQNDHRSADLADFTEAVLYFFDEEEPVLAKKNIRLLFDWHTVPIIPVVRDHVAIILRNLVDNAIDAMPQGGTLSVTLARRDEDSVLLSIADTGGGIPKEDMDHLFEPFQSTKARLGCGESGKSGLGLAVVHGLVGEFRGSITANNIPGRGARFDIVIPMRQWT